jgi:hypothetical protein
LIRLSQPFRNPLAMGSLIGLALALTGFKLPMIINAPLTLVGGIAVPSCCWRNGMLAPWTSARVGRTVDPDSDAGIAQAGGATVVAYLIGA